MSLRVSLEIKTLEKQLVPQIQILNLLRPLKRKRMSTQTRRHDERKIRRQSTEKRRREREASMILEKQDQKKTLAELNENTKKITEAAQARKLKKIIDQSKHPVRPKVTEDKRRGRDEATLKLIEEIRKAVEEEEKLKTDVKHEPITKEEVVTTSCGVPRFNLEINKVIAIKSIGGNKRLPKRLSFEMENGRRHVWPVQTILNQDYKTLVSIYNKISKYHVLGRHVVADVHQKYTT